MAHKFPMLQVYEQSCPEISKLLNFTVTSWFRIKNLFQHTVPPFYYTAVIIVSVSVSQSILHKSHLNVPWRRDMDIVNQNMNSFNPGSIPSFKHVLSTCPNIVPTWLVVVFELGPIPRGTFAGQAYLVTSSKKNWGIDSTNGSAKILIWIKVNSED